MLCACVCVRDGEIETYREVRVIFCQHFLWFFLIEIIASAKSFNFFVCKSQREKMEISDEVMKYRTLFRSKVFAPKLKCVVVSGRKLGRFQSFLRKNVKRRNRYLTMFFSEMFPVF
jgi:hypothetical protein